MNTSVNTIIDLSYLEMMTDGDDSMKKTMLDMLIEELPPELEKLRSAYLSQDFEELSSVAHKMKSTLAFVGNEPMTKANAVLETVGREGTEMQRASANLEVLDAQFKEVFPALKAESERLR